MSSALPCKAVNGTDQPIAAGRGVREKSTVAGSLRRIKMSPSCVGVKPRWDA
jgi:hypothetical protein